MSSSNPGPSENPLEQPPETFSLEQTATNSSTSSPESKRRRFRDLFGNLRLNSPREPKRPNKIDHEPADTITDINARFDQLIKIGRTLQEAGKLILSNCGHLNTTRVESCDTEFRGWISSLASVHGHGSLEETLSTTESLLDKLAVAIVGSIRRPTFPKSFDDFVMSGANGPASPAIIRSATAPAPPTETERASRPSTSQPQEGDELILNRTANVDEFLRLNPDWASSEDPSGRLEAISRFVHWLREESKLRQTLQEAIQNDAAGLGLRQHRNRSKNLTEISRNPDCTWLYSPADWSHFLYD